ncbi:JAB1/Mov34/MPN/PAD-1 ubiquitin protease-domain-containing protein [Dipodascopsis tothii]|uniref:JAB1/Mov34/MPN/PAD-1 ubiquitin protease-domain-containing protein n=1 Tax=Dipodascopsis tothii TaxID=44089 RepID=UPI0034CDEEE6
MDVQMRDASLKAFDIENEVEFVDARDEIYDFDEAAQKALLAQRPWTEDVNYFKRARISVIALLKMVMHTRSGGALEVMGMMTGKIMGDAIVVMDAYPLPVEGTETRVNPQSEAYEFMVQYLSTLNSVGRRENIVGWYHSHPGYGCWLSGIDVGTQSQNQKFQDPFLAVVIDPNRTISSGKVELGAFRTYPDNYKPPPDADAEYQTIPLTKIEDFGAHANQYYSLEVSYFKSSLDTRILELLWNKYWVSTLSQSPLLTNRAYATQQMLDLSRKISRTEAAAGAGIATLSLGGRAHPARRDESKETELDKIVRDSTKIASEELHGLLSEAVKNRIFDGAARPTA